LINKSFDHLSHQITAWSRKAVEAEQVARRLKQLLPQRLKLIHGRLRKQFGYTKALRQALVDQSYRIYIEELVEIRHEALHAKIRRETHLMLYNARQSMQSFQKAKREAQQTNRGLPLKN
jgi:hypothetical protein